MRGLGLPRHDNLGCHRLCVAADGSLQPRDIIVYVASDERYNDEVPTQFLQLLVQAGKAVVVCLTKMREADAPNLIAHFQSEVLGRLARNSPNPPNVPVVVVPFLTSEQLADPFVWRPKYRIPLLNQVLALADRPKRRGGVRSTTPALSQRRRR